MNSETRARDPQANLNSQGLDTRSEGSNTLVLRGSGDFRRDRFDRARPFTFECRFDIESGVARATYRWSGNFGGGYDDPGYSTPPSYRWPSGGGGPVYPPSGRTFFSGGIINRGSGKGLDVRDQSTRDAAPIQQWDFGGNPNQSWDVVEQGNGQFAIVSQASGKVIEVADHNASDGAIVQQYRWRNGDNQRWRLERVGGGFYQIVSVSSGRCLDVELGHINENGAKVQQWSCSNQPNQHWRLGNR
jgi:hypothetical protein